MQLQKYKCFPHEVYLLLAYPYHFNLPAQMPPITIRTEPGTEAAGDDAKQH